MVSLLKYLTNGKFDEENHSYEVPVTNKPDPKSKKTRKTTATNEVSLLID
jgi:hypothetical protein